MGGDRAKRRKGVATNCDGVTDCATQASITTSMSDPVVENPEIQAASEPVAQEPTVAEPSKEVPPEEVRDEQAPVEVPEEPSAEVPEQPIEVSEEPLAEAVATQEPLLSENISVEQENSAVNAEANPAEVPATISVPLESDVSTAPYDSSAEQDTFDAEMQSGHGQPQAKGGFRGQDVIKGTNLIVNFVPRSFNDQTLYELFSPFGEIESARCITDRQSGSCQGYGFVKFANKENAAKAVAHFQALPMDSRQLKVHFARPSSTHKQCNIYISGLPIHYSDNDVAALFEPYGPVVECKILMSK